jgi:hypothetical protein
MTDRERKRTWHVTNRKRVLWLKRRWAAANPEKIKEMRVRYLAKQAALIN